MPIISPLSGKVYTNSHLDSAHTLRYNVDTFAYQLLLREIHI